MIEEEEDEASSSSSDDGEEEAEVIDSTPSIPKSVVSKSPANTSREKKSTTDSSNVTTPSAYEESGMADYKQHMKKNSNQMLDLEDMKAVVKSYARDNVFRFIKFCDLYFDKGHRLEQCRLAQRIATKLCYKEGAKDPLFKEDWNRSLLKTMKDSVRDKRSGIITKIRQKLTSKCCSFFLTS